MATIKSKRRKKAGSSGSRGSRAAAVHQVDATPAVPKEVTVMVNGQVTGTVPDTSTVIAAAQAAAKSRGIAAFSLKLDGKKLDAPSAQQPLVGHETLELVTKDARG